jgi:hypothetical protein
LCFNRQKKTHHRDGLDGVFRMIGITSKNKLITLEAGQRSKAHLVGVLITDPEHMTEENLSRIKLHFHRPDDQLNQHRCLGALNIDQGQIDQKDDESTLKPQKFDLLNLSIRQVGGVLQIDVRTKVFERLGKALLKRLQS